MNQDSTREKGITNPIPRHTSIGIISNYLRNTRRSYIYQQKRPERAFLGETKLPKITGVRPFLGSPLLFSSWIKKSKVKVSFKFFLKNNFVIKSFFFENYYQ